MRVGPLLRLRADALEWRAVEDEVIALDGARSRYLGLNPTGALLWRRLADGATRADLVAALVECGADRERALTDVDAFVTELAGQRLLA